MYCNGPTRLVVTCRVVCLCCVPLILPGTSFVDRDCEPREVPAGLNGLSGVHRVTCFLKALELQPRMSELVSINLVRNCSSNTMHYPYLKLRPQMLQCSKLSVSNLCTISLLNSAICFEDAGIVPLASASKNVDVISGSGRLSCSGFSASWSSHCTRSPVFLVSRVMASYKGLT